MVIFCKEENLLYLINIQGTHAAVKNGVDLVIELPTMFACQSAEIFSHGAITTLNSLNCVDAICFGSEERRC